MYIIENYPELLSDVKELWRELLDDYHFEIKQIDDSEICLYNTNVELYLHTDVGQRMIYNFKNPISGVKYPEVTLYIFFNIEFNRNLVGGPDYPLSSDQWVDFYADDDFRSICRVDLPIMKREITHNWQKLLGGDFSFESDYLNWEKWYQNQKECGIHHTQLSFEHYLKTR